MFYIFLGLVAFFHTSEFVLAHIYDASNAGRESWLITWPYSIAMLCSCVEYFLELWIIPGLKQGGNVAILGLAMAVAGESLRKAAMLTAKASFTHQIRREEHPEHKLVTWGVYRYVRHPGYLGWFLWAVGTQVMLSNPCCSVAFALVSWRFFADRISYEEYTLQQLFGQPYADYARRTPTWFPSIR